MQKLGLGIEDSGDMIFALVFMLLTVTGFYWLLGWYRARPAKPAKLEQHFNRLLIKLKKLGFEKKPSEDSRAFLSRIEASDVIQTTEIEVIINLYNKIKYGPDHTNKDTNQSDLKTFNLLINNFMV